MNIADICRRRSSRRSGWLSRSGNARRRVRRDGRNVFGTIQVSLLARDVSAFPQEAQYTRKFTTSIPHKQTTQAIHRAHCAYKTSCTSGSVGRCAESGANLCGTETFSIHIQTEESICNALSRHLTIFELTSTTHELQKPRPEPYRRIIGIPTT